MKFEREGIDVLAVDDQKDILELSKLFLERSEADLSVDTTVDPEEAVDLVASDAYDAVLSDYDMPRMNGLELLEEVRRIDERLPFILYTGKGSEEVAAEAVNLGATDYFQKEAGTDHYQMIGDRLVDAVEGYRNETELEVFASIVENSDNPILVTDRDADILYVNRAFEEVTGYSEEEVLEGDPDFLDSGIHDREKFNEIYEGVRNGDTSRIDGMTNVARNGDEYRHDLQLIPVQTRGSEPDFYAAISDVLDT
jgi:PAS domain S-box-containing protein